VTYVTGSHSLKVGASDTWALTRSSSANTSALLYRFTAGVPTQFTNTPVEGGTGSKVIGDRFFVRTAGPFSG
jgi:hypothetical protein